MAVALPSRDVRSTRPFLQPLVGDRLGLRPPPFLEWMAGLLCPLLTSALRSGALRRPQSRRTRCRSLGVSPTAFLAHPPDLQPWPLMDMDFATSCPLVRPALPHIRFLFVGSRLCSTLPSDSPSRFCPCALLVLHLHQVAQGTFTPKLSDMSDTQDAARRLTPVAFGDPCPGPPLQSRLEAGRDEGMVPFRSNKGMSS